MDYSHSEIEKKWQEHWRDIKLANCDVSLEKNNFYKVVGRTNEVINVGGLKFVASTAVALSARTRRGG